MVFNICAKPVRSSSAPGMFSPNNNGSKIRTRCPRATSLPASTAMDERPESEIKRVAPPFGGLTVDSTSTPGADSPLLNSKR